MTASTLTLADLVAATPASRNRVVDLLRVVAIMVVVSGHWLMAGLVVDDAGRLHAGDLLTAAPWTQWLTWVFQVMPLFFLVGGYSNALSWRSATERGESYATWLRARLRRLLLPVVPLLLVWSVLAPLASLAGATTEQIRLASTAALVPTWFLAAYVVVVSVAPCTLRLWRRWGWWSVVGALALGGVIDAVSVTTGIVLIGFLNYLVVWGAVHQLGYAWLDGSLRGTGRRLLMATVGFIGLWLLAVVGPYATSMVGLATHEINNTYPARVTMGFMGLMQCGAVLALEPVLARWLQRPRVWAATIAVNSRIMTIYLWHLTVLGLVTAAAYALGGIGLHLTPATGAWWATRPWWCAVLAVGTAIAVALLGRLERVAPDPRPAPPVWRPLLAMFGACAGLAVMAAWGVAGGDDVRWWLPLLPVAAMLAGGLVRVGAGARRA